MRRKYETVLADWKYLFEGYAAPDDMTGAYVDQDDLDLLIKNPTKTQAVSVMISQIDYWYQAGPDTMACASAALARLEELLRDDPEVARIAEEYGC